MRFAIIKVSLGTVILALAANVFSQTRGERAARVFVAPVSFEYEQSVVEVVGTAEALRSVTLFPAVSDRVTEVNFSPGQRVEKGDVLLRIDSRRQQVALDRTRIQMSDAELDLKRLLESKSRGAVTQAQIDQATTDRDLAAVAVREAQTEYEDRLIRAPFNGVVGLTDVEVGDRINQQTPVTTIDNRTQLYVNFNAPEASLAALNSDIPVTIQPWSDRSVNLAANIAQVDSRVADSDRTIRARALLDNPQDLYLPGMSFRVRLNMRGERFAAIPEASLSWGVGGAYVWKAQQGKAIKTTVQVRQRLRGRILVSGDLYEFDTLIVEGIQRLRDGQAIAPEPYIKS